MITNQRLMTYHFKRRNYTYTLSELMQLELNNPINQGFSVYRKKNNNGTEGYYVNMSGVEKGLKCLVIKNFSIGDGETIDEMEPVLLRYQDANICSEYRSYMFLDGVFFPVGNGDVDLPLIDIVDTLFGIENSYEIKELKKVL